MKLVVLGLSLGSSWGNGHATTWRALLAAFAARGHDILFLERAVPWYAGDRRDLADPAFCRLAFYESLADLERWRDEIAGADAVIVGSYVPEGVAVGAWVQRTVRETATRAVPQDTGQGEPPSGGRHRPAVVAFYDIDTPVTLAKLAAGDEEYLSPGLIPGYDLYLSFTGGPTLARLEREHGAPAARPLYCSVDPGAYRPLGLSPRWDLSYLGTYSPDRQPTLERLLLAPARAAPDLRFVVAGPQYPDTIAWPANVERIEHVPPAEHPAFYGASRFTLNVTRADMIAAGWSPSVRLFEAAACGTPLVSDAWEGLDALLAPGREIVLAGTAADVLAALRTPEPARRAMADAARARVLAAHTAAHRAAELERHLAEAATARQPRRGNHGEASPRRRVKLAAQRA